ncbi:transposase [Oribacterium sp. oral taxon 102]|nr:transposase [Oribacterium sp. oral taxon 102]
MQKGSALLKKSSGILCEGNRLTAYRFIDNYKDLFGIRWLLHRLDIYPNAYYSYRRHRKAAYWEEKQRIKDQIEEIYHKHNGVDGYRMMRAYLKRADIVLSPLTVYKYMNMELGLCLSPAVNALNTVRRQLIRYSPTSWSRILTAMRSIQSGVSISPTCF